MHTSSGRNDPTSTNQDLGPLLTAVIALCLLLFGLPAWLLGFIAQRCASRWLSWRWRMLLWFTLACLSAYALSFLYQHGLQGRLARELTGYVLAAKHDQADFTRWPWATLWADTWPVWLHTLVATPIAALVHELVANTRGGQTTRQIRQHQRRRERAIARSQHTARKRTSRPARLPDEVGGMMVIGVPIDDEAQE